MSCWAPVYGGVHSTRVRFTVPCAQAWTACPPFQNAAGKTLQMLMLVMAHKPPPGQPHKGSNPHSIHINAFRAIGARP